jgi:hypothetical protein
MKGLASLGFGVEREEDGRIGVGVVLQTRSGSFGGLLKLPTRLLLEVAQGRQAKLPSVAEMLGAFGVGKIATVASAATRAELASPAVWEHQGDTKGLLREAKKKGVFGVRDPGQIGWLHRTTIVKKRKYTKPWRTRSTVRLVRLGAL